MRQQSFLDPPLVRPSDPPTSHAAAAKVRIPESWLTVLKILDAMGHATSNEIGERAKQQGIQISESRIRGALGPKELLGAGLVKVVSDEGQSAYGNDAQVYSLTVEGLAFLKGHGDG